MMDDDSNFLSSITMGLSARTLAFEGGIVVIRLIEAASDTLVLHSEVLIASSQRFKRSLRTGWNAEARKQIMDPETGKEKTIYTYSLTFADGGFTLNDSPTPTDPVTITHRLDRFQHCELASQFPRHMRRDLRPFDVGQVYPDAIENHKLLMALVYGLPVSLLEDNSRKAMPRIADMIALAEYYDLLPAVADSLENLVISQQFVWQHVALDPVFFLAIGKKLRSEVIFADAIRHYVGEGVCSRDGYSIDRALEDDVLTFSEACTAFFPASQDQEKRIWHIMHALQEHGLKTYQAHPDRIRRLRGPEVNTTWAWQGFVPQGWEGKDAKCEWIGNSIFREWVDFQLESMPHWSHIKYRATQRKDGEIQAGSLRKACDILIEAAENEDRVKIDFLGPNVAHSYTEKFGLVQQPGQHHHPTAEIAHQLRYLVRSAKQDITQVYDGPCGLSRPWYNSPQMYRKGTSAHHDEGLDYFTNMHVPEESMPWINLREWPEIVLPEVDMVEASEAWLALVGV